MGATARSGAPERRTIRAAGYIGAETDLRPVLPAVDVPTLILHGEADARSPPARADALHAAISTSQLVVFPRLGHARVVADPEACAEEIRRFVQTVGRRQLLIVESTSRPQCRFVRHPTGPAFVPSTEH